MGTEERDELKVIIGLPARGLGAMTLPLREEGRELSLEGKNRMVRSSCVLGTGRHQTEAKPCTEVGCLRLIPVNERDTSGKVAKT